MVDPSGSADSGTQPNWRDLLSAAVDEIYVLRCHVAEEHARTTVDLTFKTYPRSRRAVAQRTLGRIGNLVFSDGRFMPRTTSEVRQRHLQHAGFESTLTLPQWAEQAGFDRAAVVALLRSRH